MGASCNSKCRFIYKIIEALSTLRHIIQEPQEVTNSGLMVERISRKVSAKKGRKLSRLELNPREV